MIEACAAVMLLLRSGTHAQDRQVLSLANSVPINVSQHWATSKA